MGRIVVIDDEPLMLQPTQRLLQGLGHRVRMFADGRSAIELIRQVGTDIVLVDLNLPDMDGIEVLRQLHALPRPPAIIMMSGDGRAQVADRLAVLELNGPVEILDKPFTLGELEDMVARLLNPDASR